ncbi:glycosyltransferase family 39 protein [Granulicella sp. L60]|uniref:ArnT family glycosyltransferase n=1 Tax=Granulicella sp. L60 TaxID=1641866 RepID=UPI00131C8FB0|nr:glycosyltransferase family 39 protein [Granulicella sp. L60]
MRVDDVVVGSRSGSSTGSSRGPSSGFTSGVAIVGYVALVRLVLYLFAGPHYGYFRDELYYLACGEHPAWGYVDQPPLIGWITWLLEHTIGSSLWALRLLPALAGAATIVLVGLLARELGGRRWAMFLASLAVLLAPVLLALSHLFTMNAFDPLFWTGIAYLIVRIAKSEEDKEERLWLAVGALAGITILNKYGIVFWLSGAVLGVCLTPLRRSLRHGWFWLGCMLAAVIALPNFVWQWRHQFPFLQLMHNVRESGRDIVLGPMAFLAAQAQMLGFVAAVLVVFALLFFFSERGRGVRVLGWAYVVFLVELMVLHGKMYYLAPVYPMMFAAGAVWIEGVTERRMWVWVKPVLALAMVAVGGVYLPTILPVLSVPKFLAYEHTMGIEQQKFEHMPEGVLPQLYADMFGWEGIAQRVGAYYKTLSPEEQRKTAIFANNYGDAGAIDFFGPKYGLPKSIGGHQNYWIWGPRGYTGESLIVLGEGHESNMQTKCASYSVIGSTKDPLSRRDEWLPIYHCRGFKWNLQEVWPQMKKWN